MNSQAPSPLTHLAFYRFLDLEDLPGHREFFRELCAPLQMRGTILLSAEGVNAIKTFVIGPLKDYDVTADLVFTDVPGRVAKALLDLADRFGVPTPDGVQVNHDLTQEELAQLVGASRETVNKALADFAARGWIQLAAKSVLVTDTDRLRKRAR